MSGHRDKSRVNASNSDAVYTRTRTAERELSHKLSELEVAASDLRSIQKGWLPPAGLASSLAKRHPEAIATPIGRRPNMASSYRIAADAVVLFHLAFVLFVVLGGLLALRWRWIAWVHVPAVAWGVAIEAGGWICPLTPLENHLRQASGAAGYQGDFVAHYVLPVLYPAGLTRAWQLILGAMVLSINLSVYGFMLRRSKGSA